MGGKGKAYIEVLLLSGYTSCSRLMKASLLKSRSSSTEPGTCMLTVFDNCMLTVLHDHKSTELVAEVGVAGKAILELAAVLLFVAAAWTKMRGLHEALHDLVPK